MNQRLIQKLYYSNNGHHEVNSLPLPLKDSLQLISNFFLSNQNNKLCLIFPSKELASQWLALPLTYNQIFQDYNSYRDKITESYKQFRTGEKLILNNEAVVEWVGIKEIIKGINFNKVAIFRTKSTKGSASLEVSIPLEKITKLQRTNKKVLSPQKKVLEALPKKIITPLENLLMIETFGNQEFIKNKVCLITKYSTFLNSIDNVLINKSRLDEYFSIGKIDENGISIINGPLLISNNLRNLALYSVNNPITKIIIDGYNAIHDRRTDFAYIDSKNIPTILITDLTEIENFEYIGDLGFECFNFTKDNITLDYQSGNSPFFSFNNKLNKYSQFKLIREICQDDIFETITQKIQLIEKDDSNQDLTNIKIYLIQLINYVSRICHVPTTDEIALLNQKINTINLLFQRNHLWFGDSIKPIEECILLLKSVTEKLENEPSKKCTLFNTLISNHAYDYIICTTEDEARTLKRSLPDFPLNQVISVADVNDNLLTNKPLNAIITGWAKSSNINRILSSFLFTELTVLFYEFENKYFNSLQRRNRKYNEIVRSTITKHGILSNSNSGKSNGFDDLYSDYLDTLSTSENSFDILEFELKVDSAQYSKYKTNEEVLDSIIAKRIDFENNWFIYSSESHKFLVINELIEKKGRKQIFEIKNQIPLFQVI